MNSSKRKRGRRGGGQATYRRAPHHYSQFRLHVQAGHLTAISASFKPSMLSCFQSLSAVTFQQCQGIKTSQSSVYQLNSGEKNPAPEPMGPLTFGPTEPIKTLSESNSSCNAACTNNCSFTAKHMSAEEVRIQGGCLGGSQKAHTLELSCSLRNKHNEHSDLFISEAGISVIDHKNLCSTKKERKTTYC